MHSIIGKMFCVLFAAAQTAAAGRPTHQSDGGRAGSPPPAAREVRMDGLSRPVKVLSVDSFEKTLPGQLPKGWSVSGVRPDTMQPLSRYVTNARACSGRKSLAYDFSELPPGVRAGTASHGYTNRRLEKVAEGWCVLSFAFRHETGTLAMELRGPHKGGSPYQTFGVSFGDRFKGGEVIWTSATGPRASAGQLRSGAWQRLTLCFPSPGAQKAHSGAEPLCSYARIDVRSVDGGWTLGEWRAAPLGDVEITGPLTHFDLLGYGRARFLFDNVVWGITDAPPHVTVGIVGIVEKQ